MKRLPGCVALCLSCCLPVLAAQPPNVPATLEGSVIATADGDGYTYVQVRVGEESIWVFGPEAKVNLRQKVLIPTGDRRKKRRSRDLDRVFKGIYYVERFELIDEPEPDARPASLPVEGSKRPGPLKPGAKMPPGHMKIPGMEGAGNALPAGHVKVPGMTEAGNALPAGHVKVPGMTGAGDQMSVSHASTTGTGKPPPVTPAEPIQVDKLPGGQTVEELFLKKTELEGKQIAVRGKVTNVNKNIMRRNWVHVQDGTGSKGSNDLTATFADGIVPAVGDIVQVRGALTVDKDFGYGYKYEVIVEDAKIVVEGK